MENVIGGICSVLVVISVVVFAAIGLATLGMDYRHFNTIAKECKERGHIQNNRTRIICFVEDK